MKYTSKREAVRSCYPRWDYHIALGPIGLAPPVP